MWNSHIQCWVAPGLAAWTWRWVGLCALLNTTDFLLRKIKCLYHFQQEYTINSRVPVVIESGNSHANWFFCIQSSGIRAFDFHLLFSLASCSVSMQIAAFIQFSVSRKTTISCIIISVNKRKHWTGSLWACNRSGKMQIYYTLVGYEKKLQANWIRLLVIIFPWGAFCLLLLFQNFCPGQPRQGNNWMGQSCIQKNWQGQIN